MVRACVCGSLMGRSMNGVTAQYNWRPSFFINFKRTDRHRVARDPGFFFLALCWNWKFVARARRWRLLLARCRWLGRARCQRSTWVEPAGTAYIPEHKWIGSNVVHPRSKAMQTFFLMMMMMIRLVGDGLPFLARPAGSCYVRVAN